MKTATSSEPQRTLFDSMQKFHRDRVKQITSGELRLHESSGDEFLLVHLLPEEVFSTYRLIDPSLLSEIGSKIPALGSRRAYNRFNVDGFLNYGGYQTVGSYTHLHRDGRIESLMPSIKYSVNRNGEEAGPYAFRDIDIDKGVLEVTKGYLSATEQLGVSCPIWLFSCIVGCKDVHICSDPDFGDLSETTLDRTPCFFPPLKIEDTKVEISSIVRPWSDMFWQACVIVRSYNFDENNEWRERRR